MGEFVNPINDMTFFLKKLCDGVDNNCQKQE
jgi:hypothetical protein